MRANAAAMVRRAGPRPIRLASKSVRCRQLIETVLRMDSFRGVLAFTLPEALWLAECGTCDDIVVAYPTADSPRVRPTEPGCPGRSCPPACGWTSEGAGEAQTPLLGAAADRVRIGDRAWFRHAKADEFCERFNELYLIDGDAVVASAPTYRGEGQAFL